MSRICIVCGRPIRKKTTTFYFREPLEAREGGHRGSVAGFGTYGYEPPQEAKPDGHREQGSTKWSWTIYTSRIPKTKAQAQAFVNMQIVSVQRGASDDVIRSVTVWDGESYEDEFFDTGGCAKKQGYASARSGDRFTWCKT